MPNWTFLIGLSGILLCVKFKFGLDMVFSGLLLKLFQTKAKKGRRYLLQEALAKTD